MMSNDGIMQVPKADPDTLPEGAKHGYVGEEEGLVETFDAPEPGFSNAVPDVETAQARVTTAENALEAAQRDLARAKQYRSKQKAGEKPAPEKSAADNVKGSTTGTGKNVAGGETQT